MARPKPPEEIQPYGFRLPISLMARVDAFAEKAASHMPGYKVSRTDAIRVLLEKALIAEGFPAEQKAKRKA